jgi:NDP-4-keto-2,6-dideoxyhexose 3-C-methyltransferase
VTDTGLRNAMTAMKGVPGTVCRSCGSLHLVDVLDLGYQRLSDFIEPGQLVPEQHELKLVICLDCTLVQLSKTTPRGKLYHERYGFRSGTNEAVRADLEDVVKYARSFGVQSTSPRWLDIACNDGTLLSFVPDTYHRTGIDPVAAIAREARTRGANRVIYDYFDSRFFAPHEFDVITSVSMFYDLDKVNTFVDQVERVLAPGGVWVIQQNYAGDMISKNAVDNICHEHVTYFALLPLMILMERHGLEINDVVFSDVNGGCIRTAVSRIGDRPQSASVQATYEREVTRGLHRPELWMGWGRSVREELELTRKFLHRARDRGESVYLYGASTRGGTFLQMINAGPELLPFAVERSPAKVGKIMGSTGIEIIDESRMRAVHPDYLLVSPWFFRDVFVEREAEYLAKGGKLVFPLPHFEIVGRSNT